MLVTSGSAVAAWEVTGGDWSSGSVKSPRPKHTMSKTKIIIVVEFFLMNETSAQ